MFCADFLDTDVFQEMVAAHEVTVQLDVLVPARNDRIFDHLDARLVVFVEYGGSLFGSVDFGKQVSQPHDIFCANGCCAVFSFCS